MANEMYYQNPNTHFYNSGVSQTGAYPPLQQNFKMSQVPIENNTGLMTIFVNSEEEVNFYPVAAGVTVLLISFNLKKFWLKSTGKNGVPEPIRIFSFDEEITQPIQGNEYATKEEIKNLNNKIDKLISELGGVK